MSDDSDDDSDGLSVAGSDSEFSEFSDEEPDSPMDVDQPIRDEGGGGGADTSPLGAVAAAGGSPQQATPMVGAGQVDDIDDQSDGDDDLAGLIHPDPAQDADDADDLADTQAGPFGHLPPRSLITVHGPPHGANRRRPAQTAGLPPPRRRPRFAAAAA